MSSDVRHIRWEDVEREKVTDLIDRQMVTGERSMVARIFLKKGAVVPLHSHDSEQFTTIVEGALRFWIGDENAEPVDLHAGEVLLLPSNVPHKAEALEDTVDIDVFTPPRQDWLDGTDDYFHKG